MYKPPYEGKILFEKILEQHKKTQSRFVFIDFNEIDYKEDGRILYALSLYASKELFFARIDNSFQMCYTDKKVLYYLRSNHMKACFTIEIPYGKRSQYLSAIEQINHLVNSDGCVILAVDNNPYHLQCLLLVETSSNINEIREVIDTCKLSVRTDKGIDEIIMEALKGGWNYLTLPSNFEGDTLISYLIRNELFIFGEEEVVNQHWSYNTDNRKKLFISYCHKDKDIVYQAWDAMKTYGLNVWIDAEEIDVGDNIMQKVNSGISESDLGVLFISQNTVDAKFAMHEFHTFERLIIENKKNWFIIKLDAVDVDNISIGLSNFLYYDMSSNRDFSKMVDTLKSKLSKI